MGKMLKLINFTEGSATFENAGHTAPMKNIILAIFLLWVSKASFASVDCTRFMGEVEKIIWAKNCNVIIDDHGPQAVREIDACLSKILKNGVEYLVFNSDLIKESGFVTKDVIITKASYRRDVRETAESISALVNSASPELFTRYRHQLNFEKQTELLTLAVAKGTFSLSPIYKLILQCSDR